MNRSCQPEVLILIMCISLYTRLLQKVHGNELKDELILVQKNLKSMKIRGSSKSSWKTHKKLYMDFKTFCTRINMSFNSTFHRLFGILLYIPLNRLLVSLTSHQAYLLFNQSHGSLAYKGPAKGDSNFIWCLIECINCGHKVLKFEFIETPINKFQLDTTD